MIVVVAIMAVLIVVLAPALLQYNERSRAEKDNSSMDEVVNAIQLALADPDVYDEVVRFSTVDNISCYVDTNSEANYQRVVTKTNPDGVDQYTFLSDARQLDETPFFAAGNMRGVTITFAPNKGSNGSIYDLKQGVVNQYVQVSGNQRVGAMPQLYNQVRSIVGDTIFNDSQTYRNSEYTIFIRLGTTGGNDASKQDSIMTYGQWSGTNLPAAVSYQLVQDRTVGDTGNIITDINDNKWNSENGNKVTINPGDLNGGGSFDVTTSDGNQANVGVVYAYLTNDDTLILRNSPRKDMSEIKKEYGKLNAKNERNWDEDIATIKKVHIETKIYPKTCENWFKNCFSMVEIENIENLFTNNVTSMKFMFHYCENLEELCLDNFDTSNVLDMQAMFAGCKKIKEFNVSNFDTKKVKSFMSIFSHCEKLKKLDVRNFDTSSCLNMYDMFAYCYELEELELGKFNTSNVEVMQGVFYQQHKIKKIDISSWNFQNVENMSAMFTDCFELEEVKFGTLNTMNVTNMRKMFAGCNSLTTLNIDSLKTDNCETMQEMFSYCLKLTSLNAENWKIDNVTNMNDMFKSCQSQIVPSWYIGLI